MSDSSSTSLKKAIAHHRAGQLSKAEKLYKATLRADPKNFDVLNLIGILVHQRGHFEEALKLFDEAIASKANVAEVYYNKANVLKEMDRIDEAAATYRTAITIKADYIEAHLNLGAMLHTNNQIEAATKAFRTLTTRCPSDARGHYNLGKCLHQTGKVDEAGQAFDTALKHNSKDPDTHFAVANLHADMNNTQGAIKHIKTAIQLKPDWPQAYSNLGNYLGHEDDFDKALQAYDKALQLDPGYKSAHVNRGLTNLTLGNLGKGWDGYSLRYDDPASPHVLRPWPFPKWSSGPLEGKSILVWADQGLGDQILYSSMLEEVADQTSRCVLECEPRLVTLFARSFENVEVLARSRANNKLFADDSFHLQTSLVDLGKKLRRTHASFPKRNSYLESPQTQTIELRKKYSAISSGRRVVGISWKSTNPRTGALKSTSLQEWGPILETPDAIFVNLQYGDCTKEIATASKHFSCEIIQDSAVNPTKDMDMFAAQVAAMDLVISVSNTTVHLAGALGVPVWNLVGKGIGRLWYWFLGRNDSPWYPSMRLFRQSKQGEWGDVLHGVGDVLVADEELK